MELSAEAAKIVKNLKKYPDAHIHYFADRMWSMYPNKKVFDEYYQKGMGSRDLLEIEVMEGNDFDSDYAPPILQAYAYMNGNTVDSI